MLRGDLAEAVSLVFSIVIDVSYCGIHYKENKE